MNLKIRRMDFFVLDINNINQACINFVICFYVMNALNLLIKLVIGEIPYWGIISKGILAYYLAMAIITMLKRKRICAVIIETVFLALFFITYIRSNVSSNYVSIVFHAIFVYIPLGVCMYEITNVRLLVERLYMFTWPIHIILIVTLLMFTTEAGSSYSMSGGYALLTQAMIVWSYAMAGGNNKLMKTVNLIVVFCDIFLILLKGSRGPILCFAVFIMLRIFCGNKVLDRKKSLLCILTIIGILIFALNYRIIIQSIVDMLEQYGINSRTLENILVKNKSMIEREGIYIRSWNMIMNKPMLGYGIGIVSPHNIFLDFMISFGIPCGMVLLIVLALLVCRGVSQENDMWRQLDIIFVAENISLMFSGSYISSISFFMCVAICLKWVNPHLNKT